MSTDWIDNMSRCQLMVSRMARVVSAATYCCFRWSAFRPVGITASSLTASLTYACSTAAVIIWLKQLPIMSRDKGEARAVTYITLRSRICWLICQHVRDIRCWWVCMRFQRTVGIQGKYMKPPCRWTLTVRGPWQGEVGHRYGILMQRDGRACAATGCFNSRPTLSTPVRKWNSNG